MLPNFLRLGTPGDTNSCQLLDTRIFRCLGAAAILALAPAVYSEEAANPPPPQTIVVMGDSIAAGSGVERDQAFPALLQAKIEHAGLNYQVVNAGVSGDTTAGGLRRIDWLLRRPIDILLLELGGNDGLRGIPPDETRRNLSGIIKKTQAKYPEAQIVLAGMQMPANMGEEYTEAFQEIFPAVAKEHGATLIPFLLEGVGGVARLNQEDRIHPTPEGHKIVAENAWKILRPLLEAEINPTTTNQTKRTSPPA